VDEIARQYRLALEEYLVQGGERGLQKAYELGKRALAEGLGVADMIALYRQAMVAILDRGMSSEEGAVIFKKSGEFLGECMSPFEMFTARTEMQIAPFAA
jgi:hypothetical protein